MTYKAVGSANEEPGVDFFTGSHVGPFLDTGKKVWVLRPEVGSKQYQRVYISLATLEEMARAAGLLNSKDAEIDQAYGLGYSDAVKENIGGQLVGIADTLGTVAGWLGDLSRAVGTPDPDGDLDVPDDEDAGADADSGARAGDGAEARGDQVDGKADRQVDGADLDERPAGVSGNPSDEGAYLI